MNRSRHVAAAVGILLAPTVVGCGVEDEPKGSGTPQETPSLLEPTVPVLPPSESSTPATKPKPSTAEQARLDQQLRDAAWDNDVAKARRLIRRGADVNAKDETVQSAYLIATSEGYLDLLRLTLRSGAKVDDKDSWNGTGLIRAAERGHYGVVGELLQAGINRNHVNRLGWTALLEAVILGDGGPRHQEIVRILLAAGADRTIPDGDGVTALEHAKAKGYDKIASILTG